MPVRERDARLQELQELEVQLERWDKELRDSDWLDKLLESEGWVKLCELYRHEMESEKAELEKMKESLMTFPMTPDARVKMSEAVMLMVRDFKNLENFVGFPAKEQRRLEQVRSVEYPRVKERVFELQEEENRNG